MASSDSTFMTAVLTVVILIAMYTMFGQFLEKKESPVFHETGFIMLVGLLLSFLAWTYDENFTSIFDFNTDIFFYILLPPIMFAAAYNMRRRKFFENLDYIILLGVGGTIICFLVFSLGTIIFFDSSTWTYYDPVSESDVAFQLTVIESMLMSSLLCSTDIIAAVSIIKYDSQPQVFSIIFGEGIVNDVTVLVLFDTMMDFTDQSDNDFTAAIFFEIVLYFIVVAILSILLGIIFGVLSCLIFKHCRFISVSSIKETVLVFCFGLVAYTVSDLCGLSGIMSMVICAIFMAQYGWYSLSPQGKHVSSVTIQVLGFMAEAFVFIYLGLCFFYYIDYNWCWQLVIAEFFIIIVGRFVGTVCLIFFLKLFKHKPKVSFRQACFICCAGLIRGAVAFGLVLTIGDITNSSVIITTTLALIFASTLIWGSTMGLIQRVLLPNTPQEGHQDSIDGSSESVYEDFKHPNLMVSSGSIQNLMLYSQQQPKKMRKCQEWLKKLDENYLRKYLIYKYVPGDSDKKAEFMEMFEREVDVWEKLFVGDQLDAAMRKRTDRALTGGRLQTDINKQSEPDLSKAERQKSVFYQFLELHNRHNSNISNILKKSQAMFTDSLQAQHPHMQQDQLKLSVETMIDKSYKNNVLDVIEENRASSSDENPHATLNVFQQSVDIEEEELVLNQEQEQEGAKND